MGCTDSHHAGCDTSSSNMQCYLRDRKAQLDKEQARFPKKKSLHTQKAQKRSRLCAPFENQHGRSDLTVGPLRPADLAYLTQDSARSSDLTFVKQTGIV